MNHFTPYRKLLGFVALLLVLAAPLIVYAQPTLQLPGDFIFQTDGYNHSFLVKVDAHTQKQSLFYSYKNGSVQPLNWSPHGQYLAILQDAPQGDWNICILSRTGQLVSCMENRMSGYVAGGGTETYSVYQPAWSADETQLFYATDDPASGGSPEYVAGDIATGKTVRILYNKPDMNRWAEAPANGSGEFWLPEGNEEIGGTYPATSLIQFPVVNTNKTAGSSTNVTSEVRVPLSPTFTVPSHITVSALQASHDDPTKHRAQFCNFSPKGTYFAAFDWGPVVLSGGMYPVKVDPYEFDILDANGSIAYRMTTDTYPLAAIPQGCVLWSPDDKWFEASNSDSSNNSFVVNKYTLMPGGKLSIEPYSQSSADVTAALAYSAGIHLSPDGQYLLFESDSDHKITTVIGPNNEIATFPGINNLSMRPLWIPPLTAEVLIPASQTPPSLTQTPVGTPNGGSAPGGNQING